MKKYFTLNNIKKHFTITNIIVGVMVVLTVAAFV